MFNDIVRESVGEDLAGQRGDIDARGLPFEHVSKVLKIAVATAHRGLLELEGRDVGDHVDFVVGVHVAAGAVGSRVAYLDLKNVLGWAV